MSPSTTPGPVPRGGAGLGTPPFRDPAFLRQHALDVLRFYAATAHDPTGGFHHYFLDDGQVYDPVRRHLVSATRWVVTQAMGHQLARTPPSATPPATPLSPHQGLPAAQPDPVLAAAYHDGARHALRFLHQAFRDPRDGGYAWTLEWSQSQARVTDATRHAYGWAFVLLAHAHAALCERDEAHAHIAADIAALWDWGEERFWEPQAQAYADEWCPTHIGANHIHGQLSPYRGQNANMHACEALIAAYRATGQARYLDRAQQLAHTFTRTHAQAPHGWIWEHYHPDWTPDWDYHRDQPQDLFRPWGYQCGHQTEWAKLLLQLDALAPQPGRLADAQRLFDTTWQHAWDAEHGGLYYGIAPDGTVCDADKYHWVQAETLAAAGLLAQRTGNPAYWQAYDQLWAYCWTHFVDHTHGAWFRILDRHNRNHTREKSPAGKVDYHNIGACHDVWMAVLTQQPFVLECAAKRQV